MTHGEIARAARRRYGDAVRCHPLKSAKGRVTAVFIDFVDELGQATGETLTFTRGNRSALYTREVSMGWQESLTPDDVLDTLDKIRRTPAAEAS